MCSPKLVHGTQKTVSRSGPCPSTVTTLSSSGLSVSCPGNEALLVLLGQQMCLLPLALSVTENFRFSKHLAPHCSALRLWLLTHPGYVGHHIAAPGIPCELSSVSLPTALLPVGSALSRTQTRLSLSHQSGLGGHCPYGNHEPGEAF